MAMVVMGGMCVSHYYQATMLVFVFVNDDGSEERHMCTK